jgi:hypothetical protein
MSSKNVQGLCIYFTKRRKENNKIVKCKMPHAYATLKKKAWKINSKESTSQTVIGPIKFESFSIDNFYCEKAASGFWLHVFASFW